MSAQIIAITNQKGGVGKTTTTMNLGVGMAQQGKRVLLIDADPQASLTISMGIRNPDDLPVSLATLMHSTMKPRSAPHNPGIIRSEEGIDLLPSNIELSGIEADLFNAMCREQILKKCLSEVSRRYDYILIDCMPSLGMMTINALVAADSVIIPCQANFLSVKGMDLLRETIYKVQRQINPNLRIDGVLLTMVDSRTNNAKDISEALRSSVGPQLRVFDTEIPHSVRAAECALEGVSIFSHDKNGKVAAAYKALTQEVIQLEQRQKNRSRSEGVR